MFDAIDSERLNIHYLPPFTSYRAGAMWIMKYVSRFRKIRYQPDEGDLSIVLSTLPILPVVVLLRMLRFTKGRLICSVRGQIGQDCVDLGKPFVLTGTVKLLERFGLRNTNLIVANGDDTAAYIREFHALDSVVVPNGVSEEFFLRKQDDDDLTALKSECKKVVLHVGTLRPVKGIDYIVSAYAGLSDLQKSRARLVFVGKGLIDHYRDVCRDQGVQATFLGHKRNVCEYIAAADLVVNVSGGSGVSNSLLETLMLGKPVLAWDKPTFSQVVNESNGLLCPDRSVSSLSTAMGEFIDGAHVFDSDEIKASVTKYRWESIFSQWRSILEL